MIFEISFMSTKLHKIHKLYSHIIEIITCFLIRTLMHSMSSIFTHVFALLFLFFCVSNSFAEEDPVKVKAAFVFYASKYFILSNDFGSASAPVRVCSIGIDRISEELEVTLSGKMVKEHSLEYQKFDAESLSKKDIAICDIVYFTEEMAVSLLQNKTKLKNRALTVSAYDSFLQKGGLIYMFDDSNRIRFDVNISRANEVGIKLNSDFLNLANKVIR